MINSNYDMHNVDFNLQQIDKDTLNTLINGVYNYFSISQGIINGTATELEYQQFINKIEPRLQEIKQEFTYKLFSNDEIKAGNRIAYDKIILEIATLQAKTLFVDKTAYQGIVTRNESRNTLGKGWIEGGDELLTNKNAQSIQEVNKGDQQ